MSQFIEDICVDFRSASQFGDYSAIAFTNSGTYSVWGKWKAQGDLPSGDPNSELTSDSQIGFVLTFGGEGTVVTTELFFAITILDATEKETSFSSGVYQPFGMVYYDRAGRRSMVNTSDDSKLYIPHQSGDGSEHKLYINNIKWEINHTPPMEAVYYSWAYAKNSSISYSEYFSISWIGLYSALEGKAGSYLGVRFSDQIAFMNENWNKFNVDSYVWQKNDRLRFVLQSETSVGTLTYKTLSDELDFEIIAYQSARDGSEGDIYKKDLIGNYITDSDGNKIPNPYLYYAIIPYFNTDQYGIIANEIEQNNVIVQVYRPRENAENLVYYEWEERQPILNPHTAQRLHGLNSDYDPLGDGSWVLPQTSYNPARGCFTAGDCYVTVRYTQNEDGSYVFPCENLSYSDWFDSNTIDIGLPNIESRDARRQRYISGLLTSGSYIQNTAINDLSTVNSSDAIYLAEKYGAIYNVQEVGYTLKVLQSYKPTSLYIGREALAQAKLQGQDVVTSANNILSTPIVSESDYGTVFTSSCTKYLRNIYFYDAYNGAIVRDAPNGLFPVSDYGIKDFIRDKSQTFISHGLSNITVYSSYDEAFNLVFFSFIDSTDSSEDFTIAFHEPTNRWISFYDFTPDYYGVLGATFTSFKGEDLWLHNSGTRMNFYGTQYTQRVKVVSNKEPLKVKAYKAIVVDSNKIWNAGTDGDIIVTPNGSITRGGSSKLPEAWFELREGKYYSNFGRNMLSEGATLSDSDLLDGDELRGSSMSINLRNSSTDETKLFGVIVDSTYSPKSGM